MSHELICAWLGLPTDVWPPDHYSLLGLRPGETNPQLIEERVHQRLDTVRRYQMTHPDPATEAMNRIAQAFVCLSEAASKRVYDAALFGTAATQPSAPTETAIIVEDRDPLVLVYSPTAEDAAPPVRVQYDPASQDTGAAESASSTIRRIRTSSATGPPPIRSGESGHGTAGAPCRRPHRCRPCPKADPGRYGGHRTAARQVPVEAIVEAPPPLPAQPRLAPETAFYRRLVQTRRLLELWAEVGGFLASPKRASPGPPSSTRLLGGPNGMVQ